MPLRARPLKLCGVSVVVCALILLHPGTLLAIDWPWNKKPDKVAADCVLSGEQIEQGSKGRLRAKVEASDSREHPLTYAWSANGGRLLGEGPEVEVDTSELNPGVYGVLAKAQDAHGHSASCVAHFQVVPPQNVVAVSCLAEPAAVEPGATASLKAEATERLGRTLRYRWFPNGGKIQGEGAMVRLDTTGLTPGSYTVTGRVEDGWGAAADCLLPVKVEAPTLPPPPPEPISIAQIVFLRNQPEFESNGQEQLQRVLRRLQAEPGGRISIEAYAGPEETSPESLAETRAQRVKHFLLENGVAESRIQVLVGLGGRLGGLRNRTLDIIWLPDGVEY
ncbi:MAG: OmpA family protein [Acidobacteria bacterium]|nr:OmpA family protein [Acidobacteriota bacterium]